jgi:membrane fusion protein, peptide pheromone/bacteriocin exporter
MNFSQDPIHTIENLIAKNQQKSRSIYLVITLAVIAVVGMLPLVTVEISSQSRGVIKSNTENVPLLCIVSGKVTQIKLSNNALVHKGDTLLTLSKAALESERGLQDTLFTTTSQQINDIDKLLKGTTSALQTPALRNDYQRYTTQRSELLSRISQAHQVFARNKQLFDKGVIAQAEFEKYLFDYQLQQQALASFDKNQKANWENQKRDLLDKQKNLSGSIEKIKVESTNYVLLAPKTGTIENFSGIQVGSFLNASQTIATLSPNESLIVENKVQPKDIGLLRLNQNVKFQLDAFNYNQWGLLEGTIIEIDKNITIANNEAYFKVKCVLNSNVMQLKSGYTTQVTKGMTLTSRFVLTQRSLYNLLFDKVDDWLNPKLAP